MTTEGTSHEAASVREMRILADILALTLDEQPAVAATALANIKTRAREGGVTAGALKDAWRRLQLGMPLRREEVGPPSHDGAAAYAASRLRLELAELQSQVAHAEHLRRQDLLRQRLRLRQARLLATVAGVLAGAALTTALFELVAHG